MKAKVIKETTTRISAKDFNWLAEVRGSRLDVAYKKFAVSYQPLFSVSLDEIPKLIDILTAIQTAIKPTICTESK